MYEFKLRKTRNFKFELFRLILLLFFIRLLLLHLIFKSSEKLYRNETTKISKLPLTLCLKEV